MTETEQWKLDGDCDKCRKQKYCSKSCKTNEHHVYTEIRAAVKSAFWNNR